MTVQAYSQSFVESKKEKVPDEWVTITIDNVRFDFWVTENGAFYIEKVSKETGKPYRAYYGYNTALYYEGRPVFTNKDKTQYWYLTVNKNGNLSKKYLTKID